MLTTNQPKSTYLAQTPLGLPLVRVRVRGVSSFTTDDRPFLPLVYPIFPSATRANPRLVLLRISHKLTEILDYEMSLSVGSDSQEQHNVAGATGGAVAPRLDRVIRQAIS